VLTYRPLDLATDRNFLLEMRSLINWNGDQLWFRGDSFEAYRERWLETTQPASGEQRLTDLLSRGEALAEVCEDNGRVVGYIQLSFYEIEGYGLNVAEIDNIAVVPSEQRRGIGRQILQHAEELALARGCDLMQSEVGAPNEASRALHENFGFEVFRLAYEKRLKRGTGN
jgi:GNAT superfamily N-acetyltransferase